MLLKTLVENECFTGELKTEFGLSFYLEAAGKRLLFDVGASDLFIQNAQKLDVDLATVDALILSHGHYDHGGGLAAFLQINQTAPVYLHEGAFGDYCSNLTTPPHPLGLDSSLAGNPRIITVREKGAFSLAPGLILFAGVTGRQCFSPANNILCKMQDGALVADDFSHEQNLLILENGHEILLAGCCHNGILNALTRAEELGYHPDTVISGLHFLRLDPAEHGEMMDEVAAGLKCRGITCYTCHCTGLAGYERLKQTLGEGIHYLDCGSELRL